eukprot:4614719-Prymnesium_polylepis.1
MSRPLCEDSSPSPCSSLAISIARQAARKKPSSGVEMVTPLGVERLGCDQSAACFGLLALMVVRTACLATATLSETRTPLTRRSGRLRLPRLVRLQWDPSPRNV